MRVNKQAYEQALGRAKMTAMEARKASGVKSTSFSRAIRGEEVSPATVGAIAEALGVDISELILVEEKEGK